MYNNLSVNIFDMIWICFVLYKKLLQIKL